LAVLDRIELCFPVNCVVFLYGSGFGQGRGYKLTGIFFDFEICSELAWHQGVLCFEVRTASAYIDSFNFQQVILTPTHLAIVMEYAAGGELFERIADCGRFSEDEVTIYNPCFDYLLSWQKY
jgi:hypothetical protein